MRPRVYFGPATRRLAKAFDQWAEDRRGSAAIEFALISTPFFLLIFGMLEIAVIFIATSSLEFAVTEASRAVRTGQAQAAGLNRATFRALVCSNILSVLECDSNFEVDVQTLNGFNNDPVGGAGNPDGSFRTGCFGFDPGGTDDVVIVRAFYRWELLTPFLTTPLANLGDDGLVIQATTAFRNEPFGSGAPPADMPAPGECNEGTPPPPPPPGP